MTCGLTKPLVAARWWSRWFGGGTMEETRRDVDRRGNLISQYENTKSGYR